MKTLIAAAVTALSQPSVPLATLVRMSLTSEVFLNSSRWNLTFGGNVYTGTGSLGRVDVIEDSPGEVKGLNFNLSGLPPDVLAVALAENVQGKAVYVYTAIFDPATYAVLDVSLEWQGRLDVMSINESKDSASISVTAEHAGIDTLRPSVLRYSSNDQKRLFPGDLGLDFVIDQSDQQIVWPSREFYKR